MAAKLAPVFSAADNIRSHRDYTFCIFARHDPNIRGQIAREISQYPSVMAGPLFANPIANKLTVQRQAKFEFITENDINDFYLSEKLGQALLAGCVPIYYGCSRAAEVFPSSMFIDMRKFASVQEVVDYCLQPGVYEKYFTAIQKDAKALLQANHTWEGCIFDPFHSFLESLENSKFQANRVSWWWRKENARRSMGRMKRLFFPPRRVNTPTPTVLPITWDAVE